MEETHKKRNIVPLLVGLVIVGALMAMIYKPTARTATTDLLGGISPIVPADSSTTFATFCQTTWPAVAGQATQPNVPGYTQGEHLCGNPNAKIIIVEYTDFECPYCKQFHPTLQKLVYESNGQIAWVLRHYPIDELHSRARNESAASECAFEQQGEIGFWKYADKIFEVTSSNDSLSPSLLPLIAKDLGLDKAAFETCLASEKYLPKIAAQAALAEANGHGPIGTPNSRIIMNGKEVEEVAGAVDYNTLKAKTDLWLKAD
ncbi:MAG: thioredoxin domain-containing protein [Candidatus Pacebacteria bacterium]|nr:thioredoxin domain-containing protein [Candidatus Paceibacterota bacterium]